jgi:hypothetical protein
MSGLTGRIDSAQPGHGLTGLIVFGLPYRDMRLLGVSGAALTAASCVDWHVRGDDLIASYEIGQPEAVQIDIMWHASALRKNDDRFARIDLLISVRTERLDWRHDVSIEDELPAALAWQEPSSHKGCLIFCSERWIYSEFVHPADLRSDELKTHWGSPVPTHVRRHLFASESLEKGVILRARACGLFVSPDAQSSLEACYAEFLATDPPLGV